MKLTRSDFLKKTAILMALTPLNSLLSGLNLVEASEKHMGNFFYIYSNQKLKNEFLLFLTNVFHLYPEKDFHSLISNISSKRKSDQEIYVELKKELHSIKPFLSELRMGLPALKKQKKTMTSQTVKLLNGKKSFKGYMELGTTGRYIDELENKLKIDGDIYLLHDKKPGYGAEDIVERGQISKVGKFLDMDNYSSSFKKSISSNSLELVTIYIGLHHCPLSLRGEFVASIRDAMKTGGKLILRDHDVHNEDMLRMAGLAHDVFNLGTNENVETNKDEIRNFYSIDFIISYLENSGFKFDGQKLYQKGDPTLNALMSFTKV